MCVCVFTIIEIYLSGHLHPAHTPSNAYTYCPSDRNLKKSASLSYSHQLTWQ